MNQFRFRLLCKGKPCSAFEDATFTRVDEANRFHLRATFHNLEGEKGIADAMEIWLLDRMMSKITLAGVEEGTVQLVVSYPLELNMAPAEILRMRQNLAAGTLTLAMTRCKELETLLLAAKGHVADAELAQKIQMALDETLEDG